MKLLKRIKEYIKKFSLISSTEGLVVGVSGGPDSVFLINILKELGFKKLLIAHLNHKLRGEDADMDEVFVRHLAQKLKVPLYVGREDVKSFCKEKGYSIEEGARIKRFEFLRRVKEKEKMDKIVLGHNLDDQVETVTMNFIRGSGLTGISGISPESNDIIHPIISIKRDEIVEYLKEKGITFRIDRTNLSIEYLRNKLRNYLIPIIEKEFNKNFKEKVFSLAEIVRCDDGYLDKITEKATKKMVRFNKDFVCIKIPPFESVHLSIKRRIIRKVIEYFGIDLREISLKNIDEAISIFRKRTGKRIELPGGIDAIKEYGEVVFEKRGERISFPQVKLLVPGKAKISGLLIETELKEKWERGGDRFSECFDFDLLTFPLKIRLPKKGERFTPLGMKNEKKLKEFFIDEKIPAGIRWNIPIVVDGKNEIVWVVGLRISDKFKITDLTKKILCIKIKLEDDRWNRIFKRF